MGGIVKAVLPAAASLIPGVGPIAGAVTGALLNGSGGGDSSGGGSSVGGAATQVMTAAEAAAAAKQNADQAKNIMNQSLVQDTSSTNDALTQLQGLISGLQSQNPETQAAYQTAAGGTVQPQTLASLLPTVQGQSPSVAGPATATPQSYRAAVAQAASAPATAKAIAPLAATAQSTTPATPLSSGPPGAPAGYAWATDTNGDGWYRAPDPNNAQHQVSFNPTTGKYDYSDPYTGQSQFNVNGAGGASSLSQAMQNFQSDFGAKLNSAPTATSSDNSAANASIAPTTATPPPGAPRATQPVANRVVMGY